MFTAYVVVTLMAIAASTFVAVANFMRLEFVLSTAAKVSVPESWITMLGILNAAAAVGLLLGFVPSVDRISPLEIIGSEIISAVADF